MRARCLEHYCLQHSLPFSKSPHFRRISPSTSIAIYPNEHISEVMNRETKYWKKVAEKSMRDGNLKFWAVLRKMGGVNVHNSSNFLFINTMADVDKMGEIWDASKVFPDVPMESMNTFGMSTVTTQLYLQTHGWQQVANANPEEHFKYLIMVYHHTNNQDSLIKAENAIWSPFIKESMDKGVTPQTGWGNAHVLSPTGPNVKYNTISYDVYPSLKDALTGGFKEGTEFPDMSVFNELEDVPRESVIYEIVDALSVQDLQ